jgi:hypothetical protein
MTDTAPQITKRRVTMTTLINVDTPKGVEAHKHEAVDYVPLEILDAYVADAKTRWQQVTVSEEPDAGPAGYEGDTVVPSHLA